MGIKLDLSSLKKSVDSLNANLIRTASERGLLDNGWDVWSTYRHARNLTSHTYDEKKAREVCIVIPKFTEDATFLLECLQKRVAK